MRIYGVDEDVGRPRWRNWKKCRSNKINWVPHVRAATKQLALRARTSRSETLLGRELFRHGTLLYPVHDIAFIILSRNKRSCLTRNYRESIQTDGARGLFRRNITCGPTCDVRILRKPCWKWKYRKNSGYGEKHVIEPARNVFFSITWSDHEKTRRSNYFPMMSVSRGNMVVQ